MAMRGKDGNAWLGGWRRDEVGGARVAGDHLVDDDAERPPVGALCRPLASEELGCKVLRRADDGVRVVGALCQPEVAHLEVAMHVK